MKIAVTGSSGRIGRYVVRELSSAGHEVSELDIRDAPMRVDLTDAGQVHGALAGCEAVVHMGAWPNPGHVPDTCTYSDNTAGTFNVFQASADLGIKRVVAASSNQVYGLAGAPPLYAPVDEAHPLRPVNCYALSKMAGEQAADYFCRNFNIENLSCTTLDRFKIKNHTTYSLKTLGTVEKKLLVVEAKDIDDPNLKQYSKL